VVVLIAACSGDPVGRGPAETAAAAASPPEVSTSAPEPHDGGLDAGEPLTDARPRIGSIASTTWIYAARKREGRLGYLRPGTSVPLRDPAPWEPARQGAHGGCKSGRWWSVEPRGFVCDDETVTRDLETPLFRALVFAGPREGAAPFDYAFSTRAPMYGRVPSREEQQKRERRLRPVVDLAKVPRSTAGHEDLAELRRIAPTEPLPSFLADRAPALLRPGQSPVLVRREIPYGSMLSFAHAFDVEGRSFLLAPDLTLIPADRMRPFRRAAFHGVALGAAAPLPIGWLRKAPRPKLRRAPGGGFEETGERWAPRTFVAVTGKTVDEGGVTYVETREGGLFVRASDVSVVSEPEVLPEGVGPDDKWIDVSLSRGTLTLFTGKRASYSTLMSPGAGGVTPSASLTIPELVGAALTPLGSYRITVKHRAAQMTSEDKPDPESFWIADVPLVQYFRPPFAIHSTYWHEDFGQPKSGGCINLSPEDARAVFDFTDPPVPEAWSGALSRKDERGTRVVIRR
jgi:hypothetical protein